MGAGFEEGADVEREVLALLSSGRGLGDSKKALYGLLGGGPPLHFACLYCIAIPYMLSIQCFNWSPPMSSRI